MDSQNDFLLLINENFFVIDSNNNLDNITSHMYGFSISKKGILTDNYYKNIGEYKEPLPLGVYIMIRKIGKEIIINQDFYGSFGLYIFEKKEENYFAISNSFLLLEEYLLGKQIITFNKDFADNLIVTSLCSFSIEETLINEIKQIPSNAFLVIDTLKNTLKINYIEYQENTISFESKEGLKIIDDWIDKWSYIFRSLKKQTDNIYADLSGGFDTRAMMTILLNSGINMNELHIHSLLDKNHGHDIDFKIASNISSKFGFKLNNFKLDNNFTKWSTKDTLSSTFYSKIGFHKEFYLHDKFYNKPRFTFTGSGGEFLRGAPLAPIKKFIKSISVGNILGHEKEFLISSERLLNKSMNYFKNDKKDNDDYNIALLLYARSLGKYHFGKGALENFLSNVYTIQPLMDPDIRKIKYDLLNNSCHDLLAYIYVRFSHDLVNFPFQGERILNPKSIEKAEKLNNHLKAYKIKFKYNKNFYIDKKRESPVISYKNNTNNAYEYLNKIIHSSHYYNILNKVYDNNVYNWANEFSRKNKHFPLTQHYALLAIAIILENLSKVQ